MATEGMNVRDQSTNGIALENQRQKWRTAKGTRERRLDLCRVALRNLHHRVGLECSSRLTLVLSGALFIFPKAVNR